MKKGIYFLVAFYLTYACVSKKRLIENERMMYHFQKTSDETIGKLQYGILENEKMKNQLQKVLDRTVEENEAKITQLEKQIQSLILSNTSLNQKANEALKNKNSSIYSASSDQKDSLNKIVVNNLQNSLSGLYAGEDIKIEITKTIVHITISDKLLFESGTWGLNSQAEKILEKIAGALARFQHFDILIQGHTDSDPHSSRCLSDNWDLSVKRATSVVRALQTKFGIAGEKLIASGRGEFYPKQKGNSSEDKRFNRRTEIILTPRVEQVSTLIGR